ncbi:unnamed protein product [Pieris macdunnoughi]|uniref:Uncharacterized protein n=1 Tax=Pieris macdunnoughi TaxID=345717 RepID=A0A821LQQ3_9NEOP|nr:unnamed protein product [Pieris macdunnoughi]
MFMSSQIEMSEPTIRTSCLMTVQHKVPLSYTLRCFWFIVLRNIEVFLHHDSLLLNVGEQLDMVRELLTQIPRRHSGLGSPGSGLGAALQAAYKLLVR